MQNNHDHHHNHNHRKLQIWYCDGCRSVHLKTDNVCLSFSKQEFAELALAVSEIYETDVAPLMKPFDGVIEVDRVLESDLIA